MPATLRLTAMVSIRGAFFLLRKKEGGVYTGDSRWGVVVPRGGVSLNLVNQKSTSSISLRCVSGQVNQMTEYHWNTHIPELE